ncbi:MAG: FtsX-like permease family protein [bacterium]
MRGAPPAAGGRSPLFTLLRQVTGRRIRHQKVRTLLTVLGVALGVGVVVAIEVANQSALSSVDRLVQGVAASADLQLWGQAESLPASELPAVLSVPGVEDAYPVVDAPTRRPGADRAVLVLGVDLTRDLGRREWEVAEGDPLSVLADPRRVLLSAPLAREEGLARGDTLRLTTARGVVGFAVEGRIEGEGTTRILGGRTVWMDVGAASAWFGTPGRVSHIDVLLAGGSSRDEVRRELETRFPGYRVTTPASRAGQVQEVLSAFQANLRVVSLVALFVGTFLVLNTMITAVVQQRKELGLLKALGLERRGVLTLVAAEAALIGAAGSVLGAVLGLALARNAVRLTSTTVSRVYLLVDPSGVAVPLWIPAAAVLLGIGASTTAALMPALEAARIPPAQTLRRPPVTGRARSRLHRLGLLALPALAAALLLSTWRPAGELPLLGYLAGLLVLAAAALVAPALVSTAGRALRGPLGRTAGIMGRIGADNLGRHLGRSSLAVTALATGIALVICVGAMIHSFKGSIREWVDASINSDIVLTAGARYTGPANVPLPLAFADSLTSMQGVGYVNTFRLVEGRVDGEPFGLASLDLEQWQRDNPLRFVSGGPEPDHGPGEVIVSQNFRSRFGRGVGDTLSLDTPAGARAVRIFGVILDFTADRGALFLDAGTYRRWWGDDRVDTFDIFLTGETAAPAVQEQILERWGGRYDLFTMRHDQLRTEIIRDVDATFSVVYAMEAIAALIALLGIVTTLAAAAVDRRRELAILRAVGTTRRQLGSSVVLEAASLGGVGALLGLAAGVGLSWVLIYVIQFQSTGWVFDYLFPWLLAALVMTGAVAASAAAGLYPARLAADTDVIAALEYE